MLNCAINAVDIFYRFQGVSPELTKIRLYENMAAGSQLDFCIIGDFADYPEIGYDHNEMGQVRSLLYVMDEQDVHIYGEGTID